METARKYTVFVGERLVATGTQEKILPVLKARFERDPGTVFLIFDDETGKQVDFDLRPGAAQPTAEAREKAPQSGPGRPKLGVTAREITLLPRHWDWLEQQPNGISAAIRRLVDEARTRNPDKARRDQAAQATGRFLSAMSGNYEGYEEASRMLYRGEKKPFTKAIATWPKDVREYALRLSKGAFVT